MSIGARIAATLDLDAGPFDRQLTAQEAKAIGWSNRLKDLGGGIFGAKSARASASTFGFDEIIKSEQQLEAFRKQSAFDRLSAEQKIVSIEQEIASAKARVNSIDDTTAEKLQLQLLIEQKMLEAERLRSVIAEKKAGEIVAANALAAASDAATAAAQAKLEAFRKQSAVNRLSTGEKIALLEREVAVASERVNAIQGVTAEKLQIQLAIEQQLLEIERLRTAASAQTAASIDAAIAAEESSRIGGADSGTVTRSRGVIGAGSHGEIERSLQKSFGVANAIKGLLAGIGFASIAAAAEKIVSPFKEAAEDATKIADESERASTATAKLIDLKRTDPERLAFLQRDARSLQKRQMEFAAGAVNGDLSKDDLKDQAKVTADIAENALAQAEIKNRLDEEAKQKASELLSLQKQLETTREKTALAGLDDERKLEALREREGNLSLAALSKRKTEIQKTQALIDREQVLSEIKELEQQIDEKTTREKQKQADLTKRIAEATERATKAAQAVQSAQSAIANFDRNALSFSLPDAASGKRGGSDITVAAQRIQSKEDTAQNLFDFAANARYRAQQAGTSGNSFEQERQLRDATNYESRASGLRQSARELRANLPGLNEADANPLAKLQADLKSALDESKNLTDIRDSLKSESIN